MADEWSSVPSDAPPSGESLGERSTYFLRPMLPTVLCLADSHTQAEQLVQRLQTSGVPLSAVSVMSLPASANEQPAPIKGLSYPDDTSAKAASGTATGGIAGALAAVGTMGIVGLTPLLMVAPILVAGGAAVGALAGTLVTGLSGVGVPGERVGYYQQRLAEGGHLIAVSTDNETLISRAQRAFADAGARHVESYRYTRKVA